MAHYQLGLLGKARPTVVAKVRKELKARLLELGLHRVRDVAIFVGPASGFNPANGRCAAALCFQSDKKDNNHLASLVARGIPIVPIASAKGKFTKEVPTPLQGVNGLALDESTYANLVFALLECAGLLPRQRRAFISYRREEATNAALQLYADLSARGFDVFLDTHKIHPGEHFQDVLWHRLCDCDVLLMLDTKGYFESRWTNEEFGRALARGLAFVRVGWPAVDLNPRAGAAVNIELKKGDMRRGDSLTAGILKRICAEVEGARTKSVAVRFEQLIETLRRAVQKVGGKIDGVSLRRQIMVSLPKKKPIAVYPALGVPTTYMLQDATLDAHTPPAAVVYDEVGLDKRAWREHMDWIGKHLHHVVRLVPSYSAGWDFIGWHTP